MEENFYTLKGYEIKNHSEFSHTMEDYLEMIYRIASKNQYIRVNELAQMLHVSPPSSSKMVKKIKEQGYVEFEPYGIIKLTKKGKKLGQYLLHRHDVLNKFFCYINHSKSELEMVEKIEHYINEETIYHVEEFLKKHCK
ncbi:metal-dependent transcriptional regulator [Anaeromicropila populeti]|uniref:Iron (Metal) dependent repressor, DtxR family n=1 Tax=Anaeromicropila populeti TaxID=37658 RepID=A0A1I6KQX0_9FIRM|nr:metal-dependent transcriptional regulator [Anaeromicropila populeti]SFR93649.1 iron (metal) dependent repressor, DtxR family [Anaeromicropila populeti]